MLNHLLSITFVLFFVHFASAQTEILMTNAKKLDENRYDKYSGSAFLWETAQNVTIYPLQGEPIEHPAGNFNLYEGEFEIYDKDQYIRLPHKEYPKVEFIDKEGAVLTFIASPPGIKGNYTIQLYADESLRIFEERSRKLSSVTVQTPGDTQKIEKFKKSSDFYILKNNRLISFDPSKKKLSKKFGHKKEINSHIKSNKLKLKKNKDLVNLLRFMDEQGWIK